MGDRLPPLVGGCNAPRHVYIDLGVNWANTARLFEVIGERAHAYEVYGFEASPLIMPFADEYFAWLNGDRANEPLSCLPRSGSTTHLAQFAGLYGCKNATTSRELLRDCMWRRLSVHLAALRPNPRLNSSDLIQSRLARARHVRGESGCAAAPTRSSYTFVPAAAGVAGDGRWLTMYSPPSSVIRGGSIDAQKGSAHMRMDQKRAGDEAYTYRVRVVDVPTWVGFSFSVLDFVVLKMDVEGAEHRLLEQMVSRGLMPLVDVLSLECHDGARGFERRDRSCKRLIHMVTAAAPRMRLINESAHGGHDLHSGFDGKVQELQRACTAVDPKRFVLSRRFGS